MASRETSMFPPRKATERCFRGNMFFKYRERACYERLNLAAVILSALNCITLGRNYFAGLANKVRDTEKEREKWKFFYATWDTRRKMQTVLKQMLLASGIS